MFHRRVFLAGISSGRSGTRSHLINKVPKVVRKSAGAGFMVFDIVDGRDARAAVC
jgi:hypothetical protein